MRNWRLFLVLALLGGVVGQATERWLGSAGPELDLGPSYHWAALSPDGRALAALARQQERWVLQVTDRQGRPLLEPQVVPDPPARVQNLAWHASSRWLAFGSADQVLVVDLQQRTTRVKTVNLLVRQVLIRGDLLLARADETVTLWSLTSGQRTFHARVSHLLHSDLSPDGKTLALGSFGDGVRLLALPSGRPLRHLADGTVPVSPTFCRDGRWMVVGLRTGRPQEDRAALYEVHSGRQLGPDLAHPALRGLAVSHDGTRLLLRGEEQAAVWEPQTGRRLSLVDHPSALLDALSPDGRLAASSQPDGVTLWNTDTGRALRHLPHPAAPTAIAFPTSRRLEVTGDRYRLWSVP